MFRHSEDSVLTTDDVPRYQVNTKCKPSSSTEAKVHVQNDRVTRGRSSNIAQRILFDYLIDDHGYSYS